MPAIVVIGGQWGDEGKGKIVDNLSSRFDIIARFSGGDNAGHTVINPWGEFKLHIVPSGIFSGKTCIIGNGVVINPETLISEINELNGRGIDTSMLCISDRAHLIMPYHLQIDRLEEERRGQNAIGTTGKGIGPAFADKTARTGIRVGDLLDKNTLRKNLATVLEYKNLLLTKIYGQAPLSLDDIYRQYADYADILSPYIKDTVNVISDALETGKTILLEGAQGTLLDPDFGTYPFCTSSSAIAAGGCAGAGISANHITDIYGVFKAYCTRVGAGPMPTELSDASGDLIRERAHEFGTTTGRPRRCGWFDAVAARYSNGINGFSGALITRLDILDTFETLKICVAYELDGKRIDSFPADINALARCKPVYEDIAGWQSCTEDVREYSDLPVNAQKYIARLEGFIGCPANLVSVGPEREQTIIKQPLF
jgi:adenylosuccinate synthase